jgi:hypothetical protein
VSKTPFFLEGCFSNEMSDRRFNMVSRWTAFQLIIVISLSIISCILVSCGSGGDSTESPRIYQMSADAGSFTVVAGDDQGTTFQLSLSDVRRDIIWFSDRPSRDAGVDTVDNLITNIWPNVYGSVAPNALMKATIPNQGDIQIFCIIDRPVYNAATDSLTFTITYLNGNQLPITNLAVQDVKFIIIDNASNTETDEWSQLLFGARAWFESTDATGIYTFRLTSAYPDVLSYTGAPDRSSAKIALQEYLQSWQDRFGDTPPNVSISSTLENGDTKIDMVTLSAPVYDENTNSISFTAQALYGAVQINQKLANPILFTDANQGSMDIPDPPANNPSYFQIMIVNRTGKKAESPRGLKKTRRLEESRISDA